jgi:hypothetical protein
MEYNITNQDRIDLKRVMSNMDYTDNTAYIRRAKHSTQIQQGIMDLVTFMKAHPEVTEGDDPFVMEDQAKVASPFLYENYRDIFRRVLRNEVSFPMLAKIIEVLKAIEEDRVDQQEGSIKVGKLLKEMYLDSAVRHGDNLDKKYQATEGATPTPRASPAGPWPTSRSSSSPWRRSSASRSSRSRGG